MTTPTLPDWYNDSRISAFECRSSRRSRGYLRRSLAGFGEALAREFASASNARGVLSRLDPRAKIVGVLLLIVTATLIQKLIPLAMLLVVAMMLSAVGGVGARRIARVWLGVPLFSLAIILPAVTNLVTPGRSIVTICRFGAGATLGAWHLPEMLTITLPGILVAARFLLRSTDCVMLAFLLAATTDHAALVNGLRRLGMPKAMGMVLSMAQRYLVILVRAAEEIHLAKLSRTISTGPTRREQHWVASGMGSLFRRTHRLAREIHDAMISRGYDGDLKVGEMRGLHPRDIVWLVACAIIVVSLVSCEHIP